MIRRLSWIFLAILGVATSFIAYTSLSMGTVTNVGSAVYPLILSGLIIVIALYVLIVGDKEEPHAVNMRGFTGVVASVVVFIAAIEHIGLIPTVVASMVVAYAGQTQDGYRFFLVYASLFAVATWLLFTLALGLPLPAVVMP
jgi:hypothetical protein